MAASMRASSAADSDSASPEAGRRAGSANTCEYSLPATSAGPGFTTRGRASIFRPRSGPRRWRPVFCTSAALKAGQARSRLGLRARRRVDWLAHDEAPAVQALQFKRSDAGVCGFCSRTPVPGPIAHGAKQVDEEFSLALLCDGIIHWRHRFWLQASRTDRMHSRCIRSNSRKQFS